MIKFICKNNARCRESRVNSRFSTFVCRSCNGNRAISWRIKHRTFYSILYISADESSETAKCVMFFVTRTPQKYRESTSNYSFFTFGIVLVIRIEQYHEKQSIEIELKMNRLFIFSSISLLYSFLFRLVNAVKLQNIPCSFLQKQNPNVENQLLIIHFRHLMLLLQQE